MGSEKITSTSPVPELLTRKTVGATTSASTVSVALLLAVKVSPLVEVLVAQSWKTAPLSASTAVRVKVLFVALGARKPSRYHWKLIGNLPLASAVKVAGWFSVTVRFCGCVRKTTGPSLSGLFGPCWKLRRIFGPERAAL